MFSYERGTPVLCKVTPVILHGVVSYTGLYPQNSGTNRFRAKGKHLEMVSGLVPES